MQPKTNVLYTEIMEMDKKTQQSFTNWSTHSDILHTQKGILIVPEDIRQGWRNHCCDFATHPTRDRCNEDSKQLVDLEILCRDYQVKSSLNLEEQPILHQAQIKRIKGLADN